MAEIEAHLFQLEKAGIMRTFLFEEFYAVVNVALLLQVHGVKDDQVVMVIIFAEIDVLNHLCRSGI